MCMHSMNILKEKYERVDCNDWVSPQEIHETKSLNQEDIKEKQCRID